MPKTVICKTCKIEFKCFPKVNRKFCSPQCYRINRFGGNRKIIKICLICEQEFESYITNEKKYCDRKCYGKSVSNKYKKLRTKNYCKQCKMNFLVAKHNKNQKFCSRKCKSNYENHGYVSIKCQTCNKFFSRKKQIVKYGRKRNPNSFKFCSIKCLNINRSIQASEKRNYARTKPELKFENLLKQNNIRYKRQFYLEWKTGWKKFYDFYIPDKNLLIEIDGIYWHGKNLKFEELNNQQKHTRDNDTIKNKLAKDRGFKLIRIWSDEIKEINMRNLL